MREAHQLGLTTSATMMFGHIETPEERIEHMISIRQVQSEKPEGATGFISFIPWPFQDEGTTLQKVHGVRNSITADQYIRRLPGSPWERIPGNSAYMPGQTTLAPL